MTKRAIVDIVKWDFDDTELAHKHPDQDLATWTQLIVSQSQEAVVLFGGQMEGPFAPGRHTLTTENVPFLQEIMRLPFGGQTPFTAEVYFVNRSVPTDVQWSTADEPLQLLDPKFNVIVPVIAQGRYGVAIEHTKPFLLQMVGSKPTFTRRNLQEYLVGVIHAKAKDVIAKYLVQRQVSILDIAAHMLEISAFLKEEMAVELSKKGLHVDEFYVTSISPDRNDSSVDQIKQALSKRAARDIQNFTYQQERGLDVLETAAGNDGTAGGMLGAGMGLGLGAGVGNVMGGAMSNLARSFDPVTPPPPAAGATPPGAPQKDRVTLLRELAQLKAEGVLTEEEFAREKQRVLGGP